MEPFNNDMAYSYLNGLISRREISFEEQKRHYETNKHLLDQAGDVIRSWMTGYRQTHVHSRDQVSSAYAPAKAHVSPRGSPAFYKDDCRNGNTSSTSGVSFQSPNIIYNDDREIVRNISEQRMRQDDMMRRLSSMESEHDKLVKEQRNLRRASVSADGLQHSNFFSSRPSSGQTPRQAACDVGLKKSSMSVLEKNSSNVYGMP